MPTSVMPKGVEHSAVPITSPSPLCPPLGLDLEDRHAPSRLPRLDHDRRQGPPRFLGARKWVAPPRLTVGRRHVALNG